MSVSDTVRLKCPRCHATPLTGVEQGFRCDGCGASYSRERQVLRFVDTEQYSNSFGFQWNRFSRTQLDSASGTTRSRDAFVEKTGWSLDALKGKTVLDAGCGMGRFAEICANAGAEVHGADLSTAVYAAAGNLGSRPNVHLYQADIFNLPFAPGSFDYIYSIGVLHHTPDTRRAFLSLVPLLKPGGHISIWVYASQLRYTLLGAEILRPLTTRLPQKLLMSLCRVAVPLYYIHRLPVIGTATAIMLPSSLEADPNWRWLDTFDWYSPTYQWKHTATEVHGWFKEAGLTDIRLGLTPVSVFGKAPDAPRG